MIHTGLRSVGQYVIAAAFFLIFLSTLRVWITNVWHSPKVLSDLEPASQLPCRNIAGAIDTLVVLKTGATELLDKLPIHLNTNIRCYPNYVVYSDYREYYDGQLIIDVLESVSQDIREEHPDFELYRRLRLDGRSALRDGAFQGDNFEIKTTGHAENPGWKLDKWKFLPMVNRTLHDFPNMKWYVFAEVDTYIVWTSMLQYLSALDPTQLVYTVMYMTAGTDVFAHGGSGFVLSRPALLAVAAYYLLHQKSLEEFVDNHWAQAGDCALGKAMMDAGVPFTNAWPVMKGDYPGWLTYDVAGGRSMVEGIAKVWCTPVATLHHVSADAVRDVWAVEQEWTAKQDGDSDGYLRQMDMFDQYTSPRMAQSPMSDWNNESDTEEPDARSMEECEQACQRNSNCVQYSFEESSSKCRNRDIPRLGLPKPGFRSGWLTDRIRSFRESMPDCSDATYIM